MSTDSTRSSVDSPFPSIDTLRGAASDEAARQKPAERQVPERVWLVASAAIMVEAALLRLYDLELKPLHHDEGVNGFFLTRLFRTGIYEYDPANYHGPTLYYFSLVMCYLFGLNTFAIRLVTALSGIGAVWLALSFRRRIGAVGALTAAAMLAVSPGAVYLSRYFIHESLFVLFTLGIVVAALRYANQAQARYLMLAAALAALLFATKETAIISAGVLIIAALAAAVYSRIRIACRAESKQAAFSPHEALARMGGARRAALLSTVAVAIFIIFSLLLYSSFLTNPRGVSDAVKSLAVWARVGTTEHVSEWYRYLWWLLQKEAPLLILGMLGAGFGLWRGHDRLAVFTALWAVGILAAYSIVPYKTPWLMLNFIIPLAIASGYGVSAIYGGQEVAPEGAEPRRALPRRAIALAVAGAAIVLSLYQTIDLNFVHYDDESYVYVYAHTRREALPLMRDVETITSRYGEGEQTPIAVTSPEYWPLPWYLRNYTRVGYHGRVVTFNDPLVIGSQEQEPELHSALGEQYKKIGSYAFRPGVVLVLYARRDVVE